MPWAVNSEPVSSPAVFQLAVDFNLRARVAEAVWLLSDVCLRAAYGRILKAVGGDYQETALEKLKDDDSLYVLSVASMDDESVRDVYR